MPGVSLFLLAQVDPEAAKIVVESGIKVVMIPLEVTHTALADRLVLEQICVRGTPFLDLIKEIITYFADTYSEMFGFESPPIHDPCAVAYVIDPGLFQVIPDAVS